MNDKAKFNLIFAVFLLLFSSYSANSLSQTTSDAQLWVDGEFNYVFKQKYLFQNEISAQALLAGGNEWFCISNTPEFEWNINQYVDLVSAIPFAYTMQKESENTFELRAMLGARCYLTPTHRPQVRILTRLEERWAYDGNTDSWDIGNRIRIRGELIYPLNKHSYFEDNMWYTITDAEVFLSTSKDISERFANRTRFRVGAGYRLTYKLRFEAIYTLQLSRNTMDNNFDTFSNILRLRVKYYFD